MTNARNTSLALLAGKTVLGATLALGMLVSPHSNANATTEPSTINLSEIADELDTIPSCVMEDGSDIIPTIAGRCVWTNAGNAWLTYEDRSYLIVDDTTTN